MTPVATFELVLLLLLAVIVLELLARWWRLPPAAALICGGGALTIMPGMPAVALDPDLVLTLFLPPLLVASAYFTAWRDLRTHLFAILNLAIGAVVFTTLLVGVAVHWTVPALPWAACFALGAVVSPPDAVAAKAVLEHVRLPRRTVTLLEGESLFNDAAGIVLFRFAVAAALTGTFDAVHAAAAFVAVAAIGTITGVAVGAVFVAVLRALGRMRDNNIAIATTLLMPWTAYIGAERLGGSGVIATVIAGLMLGWFQHDILNAAGRRSGTAVWLVMVHLLEAFVFVLIGLSLNGVQQRFGSATNTARLFGAPVLAVLATVILSRFAWVFGTEFVSRVAFSRARRAQTSKRIAIPIVMSWAGMRGVVTLAIALSLPAGMPGRDLILVSAFVVILATVLGQGGTLGALIRTLGIDGSDEHETAFLTLTAARAHLAAAELAAVRTLAFDGAGVLRHPRLLEQYAFRAKIVAEYDGTNANDLEAREAHYAVVLAAVAAGRAEALRLLRAGRIRDESLRVLEHELDLEQITAERLRTD